MQTTDLTAYAYTSIKEKIVHCEFQPGSLLNETQLCAQLEISRTPVREALSRLAQEGLIQTVPKKGILVQSITVADIRQMYEARSLLEPYAVRVGGPFLSRPRLVELRALCMGSADEESGYRLSETDKALHLFLSDNCGNRYIAETMRRLWDQNTRIQFHFNNIARFDSARDEHLALIDAILAQQYDAAADIIKQHIGNCMNCTFQALMK